MSVSFRSVVRVLLLLAFVFSAVPLAAQADTCDPNTDYISRGRASLDESQYGSAVAAYSCAIEMDPTNYDAYLGRASARILAAALRGEIDFNVTSDLNVLYDEAYSVLTSAISEATSALQTAPDSVGARAVRGYLYWYSGQNQNAIADFDAIVRQDDGNVFAYVFRGVANQYAGNEAKADADFATAISVSNQAPGVYAQIGAAYANTGNPERGIEYYNLALEGAPENATYYSYRGYAYGQMRDYAASIADYTLAIQFEPDNVDHYLNRAWAYERLGEYAAAAADYGEALRLDPTNAYTYELRGWAFIELTDYEQAVSSFVEALQLDENARWSHLGMGTAWAELGNLADSAGHFQRYIDLTRSYETEADTMKPGNSQALQLSDGQVYVVPLNAEAGMTLDIEATARSSALDPMILLLGVDGTPLAGSDDITNGNLNSAIRGYTIPVSGGYTLLVTHAGGGSYGTLDVDIILTGTSAVQLPTQQPTVVSPVVCALDGSDVARAEAFILDEDFEAAHTAYTCALEADPNNADLLVGRGLAGLMFGPNNPAVDDITAGYDLDQNAVFARITDFSMLLERDSDNLYARIGRGYLHWFLAQDGQAMEDYEAILALEPENLTGLLYRGSSLQYMLEYESAEADFARVITLAPENVAALEVIIYSYVDTDDPAAALDYLDRLLTVEPDNTEFLLVRAQVHEDLGNTDLAVANMNALISLDPTNGSYRSDLGWLLLRAGRYVEAVSVFDDALEADSTLDYAVLGRATTQTLLGNTVSGALDYADFIDRVRLETLAAEVVDGVVELDFFEGTVFEVPLQLTAGQTIDIDAVSLDGAVDTLLVLLGPDALPLVGNDDADEAGGIFDARIEAFIAPETGRYTLVVGHAGAGSEGPVDVIISGLEASAGGRPSKGA